MRVKNQIILLFYFPFKEISEENKNCSCTEFLTSVEKKSNSSRYSLEKTSENETYSQSSTEHQRTQPGR